MQNGTIFYVHHVVSSNPLESPEKMAVLWGVHIVNRYIVKIKKFYVETFR